MLCSIKSLCFFVYLPFLYSTCNDLAVFQCELTPPSPHPYFPAESDLDAIKIKLISSCCSWACRAISRSPCIRTRSIISPNFYYHNLLCHSILSAVWSEISDKYEWPLATALLCLLFIQIGTFHNCPPELSVLPVTHWRWWSICLLSYTKQMRRPFFPEQTLHMHCVFYSVCTYNGTQLCTLAVNAPCDLIPPRMWLFGCSIGHLAFIHTTLKALKSSCRQDRRNTWLLCVCVCSVETFQCCIIPSTLRPHTLCNTFCPPKAPLIVISLVSITLTIDKHLASRQQSVSQPDIMYKMVCETAPCEGRSQQQIRRLVLKSDNMVRY